MRRMRTTLCAMVGALLLWLAVPPAAEAQDSNPAADRREAKKKKRAEKRKKQREGKKREGKRQAQAERHASDPPATEHGEKGPAEKPTARDAAQAAAREAAQGVDAAIVKEGDTSVKVMQFTGLDIEGRLKSPQLLYFVNRVRAVFDRPRLPHGTFMPEVERAAEAEPLR